MTVVVADTSPLNYLILIEAIDLLPRLYKNIIIPAEVETACLTISILHQDPNAEASNYLAEMELG